MIVLIIIRPGGIVPRTFGPEAFFRRLLGK